MSKINKYSQNKPLENMQADFCPNGFSKYREND